MKRFSDEADQTATTGKASAKIFVRFLRTEGGHLHVDVAKPEYFKDEPPEVDSTWDQVEKQIAEFATQTFKVKATAIFTASKEEIQKSPLYTLMSLETRSGDISMKLTSGTLTVTGATLRTISWRRREESGNVEIKLNANIETQLDELYLSKPFEMLSEVFKSVVLK